MLVEFINVNKKYDDKKVLNNLSFSIEEGSTTALVGNNGAGKTTTINILCNLIDYDSGEAIYNSKKISLDYVSYKKDLGILLSKPYYVEQFTAREYLKFVCKFQQVSKDQISKRIQDVAELLQLEIGGSKAIKSLSSGNQIKVSLAASLIHNPKMLILDEPFVNLDMGTVENVINILKKLKGQKTILITSHILDPITDLCDDFLVMENGGIQAKIKKDPFKNSSHIKNEIRELLLHSIEKIDLEWLK